MCLLTDFIYKPAEAYDTALQGPSLGKGRQPATVVIVSYALAYAICKLMKGIDEGEHLD